MIHLSLKRFVLHLALIAVSLNLSVAVGRSQQAEQYDYHEPADMIVTMGRQALMICNGLFVSNRTLEQVYEQELKLYRQAVLPPSMVKIAASAKGEG